MFSSNTSTNTNTSNVDTSTNTNNNNNNKTKAKANTNPSPISNSNTKKRFWRRSAPASPLIFESTTTTTTSPSDEPLDPKLVSSLRAILDNPPVLKVFFQYLKETEFSDENLLFYQGVEKYKNLTTFEQRLTQAHLLLHEYILQKSPNEINIDVECRVSICEAIKNIEKAFDEDEEDVVDCSVEQNGKKMKERSVDDLPADIFDEAQRSIYSLLNEHSFPRFRRKRTVSSAYENHL